MLSSSTCWGVGLFTPPQNQNNFNRDRSFRFTFTYWKAEPEHAHPKWRTGDGWTLLPTKSPQKSLVSLTVNKLKFLPYFWLPLINHKQGPCWSWPWLASGYLILSVRTETFTEWNCVKLSSPFSSNESSQWTKYFLSFTSRQLERSHGFSQRAQTPASRWFPAVVHLRTVWGTKTLLMNIHEEWSL